MSDDSWNWERDEFEDELPMAERVRRARRFDPVARAVDARVLRYIMTWVRFWRFCPKAGCRRAKKCVDPNVECAWRKLPYLQRGVFPALMKMKEARLAELDAQNPAALPPKPH